jgi:hypothetical protein
VPADSPFSAEQIRANLGAAHADRFGLRGDEALSAALDTTSQAVALLLNEDIGAYESEPDFITGSSEKETSA